MSRLPVIIAAEAAECSLASLAMVAAYHGHDVDLNGLRRRFGLSLAGASLRTLVRIGEALAMQPRVLRMELAELAQAQTPAILHWDLKHFVVLAAVRRGTFVIHDPGRGVLSMTAQEVSHHFTGIVLEFAPPPPEARVSLRARVALRSLWSASRGFGPAALQVLALTIALQVVTFAAPLQLQLTMDQVIGRGSVELLPSLMLAFASLVVLQTGLDLVRTWTSHLLANQAAFQLVGNVVRHLFRLPTDFFEKRHSGDIISRLASTAAIHDLLTRGAVTALIDAAMALIAVAALVLYAPALALIVVAASALALLMGAAYMPRLRVATAEHLVAAAVERSHVMETLRAAPTLKLMGREAQRESLWQGLYANVLNATGRIAVLQVGRSGLESTIAGLSGIAVVYMGARAILQGEGFSIGMLVAFLAFRQIFAERMASLMEQVVQLRLLGVHLERLSDVITAKPEAVEAVPAVRQTPRQVELCDVSFRYGFGDRFVLRDVSLRIGARDFVAITGRSGGGKTTLLKVLLGLHAPTEGFVRFDGEAAGPRTWAAWRREVGVVMQHDQLISGTIAENIAFFDPELDMDAVRRAATAARLAEDIGRMARGLLTPVGEGGRLLSGGQRQRVLIARALYREPTVLVFDEGTANLDAGAEDAIAELLAGLPLMRIVVAHRPALVARADRVFVMEDGRLTAAPSAPVCSAEVA